MFCKIMHGVFFCCTVGRYSVLEYCRKNTLLTEQSTEDHSRSSTRHSDNTCTNKACHVLQNHVTESSIALPKCWVLSTAQGSYRARCFICHSSNLTQNICKSWE